MQQTHAHAQVAERRTAAGKNTGPRAPAELHSFLERCLQPLASDRATCAELLAHPFIANCNWTEVLLLLLLLFAVVVSFDHPFLLQEVLADLLMVLFLLFYTTFPSTSYHV